MPDGLSSGNSVSRRKHGARHWRRKGGVASKSLDWLGSDGGWFVLEQAPWSAAAVKRPLPCRKDGGGANPKPHKFLPARPLQTPSRECASSIPSLALDALSIPDRLDMEQADGCRTSWSILSLRTPCLPCPGARLPRLRPWPDLLRPCMFRHCAPHHTEGGWPALPERSAGTPTTRAADGPLPGAEKKSDASPFPCAPLRCSTDIGARDRVCGTGARQFEADHRVALPLLRSPMFGSRAHRLS